MMLVDSLLSWTLRSETKDAIKDKLLRHGEDESNGITQLTKPELRSVLTALGFYKGGRDDLPKPQTYRILLDYFQAQRLPTVTTAIHAAPPGMENMIQKTAFDRWSWPSQIPAMTEEDEAVYTPLFKEGEIEVGDQGNTCYVDTLSTADEIKNHINNCARDDDVDDEREWTIAGITMPEEAEEQQLINNTAHGKQQVKQTAIAQTKEFMALIQHRWTLPNAIADATKKADKDALETRHAIVAGGVALAILHHTTQDLLDDNTWFMRKFNKLYEEIQAHVDDVLRRMAGDPNRVTVEDLYPQNIGRENKGRPILLELHNKFKGRWEYWLTPRESYQPTSSLFHGAVDMEEDNMDQSQPQGENAIFLTKLIDKMDKLQKDEDKKQYLDIQTWNESNIYCTFDIDTFNDPTLKVDYPANHEARKILAANGYLEPAHLTQVKYEGTKITDRLAKPAGDKLKFLKRHLPTDHDQVNNLLDRLLKLIAEKPQGIFNFELDFRFVNIKLIKATMRKIKLHAITSPHEIDAQHWFNDDSRKGYTLTQKNMATSTGSHDTTMSLKVAQIAVLLGEYFTTADMLMYRESIRETVDTPEQTATAKNFGLLEQLVFWGTRGFKEPGCKYKDFQTYLDNHMLQTLHRHSFATRSTFQPKGGPYGGNQWGTQKEDPSKFDKGNRKGEGKKGKKGLRGGQQQQGNRPPYISADNMQPNDWHKDTFVSPYLAYTNNNLAAHGMRTDAITNAKSDVTCHTCNEKGHHKDDCPKFHFCCTHGGDCAPSENTYAAVRKAWHGIRIKKSIPTSQSGPGAWADGERPVFPRKGAGKQQYNNQW